MKAKTEDILNEALENFSPKEKEFQEIEKTLSEFKAKLEQKIKLMKIDAEIFIGGSFAKKTMIKKEKYDVDIFLRFNQKYKEKDISNLTKKMLCKFCKYIIVHGSRDYFVIKINKRLYFELIPVMKIKNPSSFGNITDLSYLHVKYINKKIKSNKLLNEIVLAKAFCYSNQCYGAESYIHGFSGYSLELLVYYYGGFIKFIKAISKSKDKMVIDIEKKFKNKNEILMDLNGAKLLSPIILIDPTYKQRNALAALSYDTFKKFKKDCVKFLKKPSIKYFETKKINLEKIKQNAKKKHFEFILLETKTNKPKGDVAGSKLLKFYTHLSSEIEKYFYIKNKGFNYSEQKGAKYFFVVKSRKEVLLSGPKADDLKNVQKFKKIHKNTFVKSKKIYAKEKIKFDLKSFINSWQKKNKKKIKEMSVTGIEILNLS